MAIGETGLGIEDNLACNSWFDTTQYALQPKLGGSKRYRGPRSLLRNGMMMPIKWDD